MGLHLRSVEIVGPYNPAGAGRVAQPAAHLRRARRDDASEEPGCARTILSTLARRAYRRPVAATPTSSRCWRSTRRAARRGRASTPASSWRSSGCWSVPSSCSASSAIRRSAAPDTRVPHQRSGARLAALVLPVEQHPRRRAARPGGAGPAEAIRPCSSAQVTRMLADPRAEALVENFAGQWLYLRNLPSGRCRSRRSSPTSTTACAGVPARDRAVLRQHRPRGPRRARPADRQLHVPQRAARAALRHPERQGQPLPARDAGRRQRPRAGCSARAAS